MDRLEPARVRVGEHLLKALGLVFGEILDEATVELGDAGGPRASRQPWLAGQLPVQRRVERLDVEPDHRAIDRERTQIDDQRPVVGTVGLLEGARPDCVEKRAVFEHLADLRARIRLGVALPDEVSSSREDADRVRDGLEHERHRIGHPKPRLFDDREHRLVDLRRDGEGGNGQPSADVREIEVQAAGDRGEEVVAEPAKVADGESPMQVTGRQGPGEQVLLPVAVDVDLRVVGELGHVRAEPPPVLPSPHGVSRDGGYADTQATVETQGAVRGETCVFAELATDGDLGVGAAEVDADQAVVHVVARTRALTRTTRVWAVPWTQPGSTTRAGSSGKRSSSVS